MNKLMFIIGILLLIGALTSYFIFAKSEIVFGFNWKSFIETILAIIGVILMILAFVIGKIKVEK